LEVLFRAWKSMKSEQMHFIPTIIEDIMNVFNTIRNNKPILDLCMELFYSVLQREWTEKNSISACEGMTQKCVVESKVDDTFSFIKRLEDKFKEDEVLRSEGLGFVQRLRKLLVHVEDIQKYDD